MPKVFISYRKKDTADITHRIYDHLVAALGKENVFMDVDTIDPGAESIEVIKSHLAGCEIMFVVIGRAWRGRMKEAGKWRIQQPNDLVRIEVETALNRGIRTVPLLIGETPMPDRGPMPESIQRLWDKQYFRLHSTTYFHEDLARVLKKLDVTVRNGTEPLNTTTVEPRQYAEIPPEESPSRASAEQRRNRFYILAVFVVGAAALYFTSGYVWKLLDGAYAQESERGDTVRSTTVPLDTVVNVAPLPVDTPRKADTIPSAKSGTANETYKGQLLVRKDASGLYGYGAPDGTTIIDARFDAAEAFSGAYACVLKDGFWGVIDRTGRFVLYAEYEFVYTPVESYTVAFLPSQENPCLVNLKKEAVEYISTSEYWSAWETTVLESSFQERELVVRVLQIYPDVDKRVHEIRNMAATYPELRSLSVRAGKRLLQSRS